MAIARIEQGGSNASVTMATSGVWSTDTNANHSGGTAIKTAVNGATETITVASSSGYTGCYLIAPRTTDNFQPTVTVDGGTPIVWNQWNYTTDGTVSPWFRTGFQPIVFANPAAAHTIVITAAGGGAWFDAVEFFTSVTPTAGLVTSVGMSIPNGFGLGAPSTQKYSAVLASMLGGPYADDTTAGLQTNGESLAQGSALANGGTANGGTDGTFAPGWVKIDGNTLWALRQPEIALANWTINDVRQRGTPDPAGVDPAGLGYARQQAKQRWREIAWKMMLHAPTTLIFLLGLSYVTRNTTTGGYTATGLPNYQHATEALGLVWDSDLNAVANEATMRNVYFLNTFQAFLANGADALLQTPSSDGVHPNADGHALIARMLKERVQAIKGRPGFRAAGVL